LQAEISNPASLPKSFRAVAKEFGFDPSYLVKQCPDEAQVIKARYEAYEEDRKQRTRAQLFAELQQIMTRLAADGIYPSQKRVAAELSRSWFLRLPEGRAAWRHLLAELGKQTSGTRLHSHLLGDMDQDRHETAHSSRVASSTST